MVPSASLSPMVSVPETMVVVRPSTIRTCPVFQVNRVVFPTASPCRAFDNAEPVDNDTLAAPIRLKLLTLSLPMPPLGLVGFAGGGSVPTVALPLKLDVVLSEPVSKAAAEN